MIQATGKRKTAIARILLDEGNGEITVNKRSLEDYFPSAALRASLLEPLEITQMAGRVDFRVSVQGGGVSAQAGAVRHGLARALLQKDESFKKVLREHGMLTRDARKKERKKYGQPGARKRFQFSKR